MLREMRPIKEERQAVPKLAREKAYGITDEQSQEWMAGLNDHLDLSAIVCRRPLLHSGSIASRENLCGQLRLAARACTPIS